MNSESFSGSAAAWAVVILIVVVAVIALFVFSRLAGWDSLNALVVILGLILFAAVGLGFIEARTKRR